MNYLQKIFILISDDLTQQVNGLTFAQNEEGNWGYIPSGADTVIPFKTGNINISDLVPTFEVDTNNNTTTSQKTTTYTATEDCLCVAIVLGFSSVGDDSGTSNNIISTTGTELKYVKQYTGKYINLRTGVYFLHSGEKITMKSYGANYQNRTLIKVI